MGAVSHGGTDARGFDKEFTRWTVPNVETLSGNKTITSTDARVQLLNPGAGVVRTIVLDASLHVVGTRVTIRNTEGWNGSALNYGTLSVTNSTGSSIGFGKLGYGSVLDVVYIGSGTTGWQVIDQSVMHHNGSGVAYGTYSYFAPTSALFATSQQVGIGASPSSLFHVTAAGDANALRVDNTTGYIGMGSSGNQSGVAKLEVVTGITSSCGVHITNTKANNTDKLSGVTFGSYGNTDFGFAGIVGYGTSAANRVSIGGNNDHYACTNGVLLAGATTTTLYGTVVAAWTVTGFGVGNTTTPSSLFHVTASGNANALRVDNTTGNTSLGVAPNANFRCWIDNYSSSPYTLAISNGGDGASAAAGIYFYSKSAGGPTAIVAAFGSDATVPNVLDIRNVLGAIRIFTDVSGKPIVMVPTGSGVAINEGYSGPDASAILDVTSTTKGLGLPTMTTTQRDAIGSPRNGLLIYNSTTTKVEVYNGAWTALH